MTQAENPHVYALLVGINQWKLKDLNPLAGCENDVKLMRETLIDHYGVPEENILTLIGEQGTHEGIKEAFKTHLTGNARKMANNEDAAFVFHYSGHGSRSKNPAKPLGKDETIVPWDSRVDGIVDIKDWELGGLIDELTEFSNNVTIIMDCCHSGSGTRNTDNIRQCAEDNSDQPDLIQPKKAGTRSAEIAVQSTEPTISSPEKYALLAGCRSDQVAFEYEKIDGNKVTHYGNTTYMLCQELQKPKANQLTYRELLEQTAKEINKLKPEQTPQCEGDVDRVFLSPYRPLRNLFLKVIEDKDGLYWIDGGLAHGITEGTQLHVYPADARRAAAGEEPLATIVVDQTGAVKSGCSVLSGSHKIAMGSRVGIYRVFRNGIQRSVSVTGASASQLKKLKDRSDKSDAKGLFKYVDEADAEIQVTFSGGRWGVRSVGTVQFWCGEEDLDLLVSRMKELIQFVNARAIKNDSKSSALAGKLKLEIKQVGRDPETSLTANLPIEPAEDGILELTAGKQRIVYELTNLSSQELWFVVLAYGYDGSISQLYPRNRGTHEKLKINMTAPFVSKKLKPGFAPGEEQNSGVIETIKVIAATHEADFQCLLRNRIASTPPPALSGTGGRLLSEDEGSSEDEWTTAEVSYRLVSENLEPQQQTLSQETSIKISGSTLQMIPPAGFEAKVGLRPKPTTSRLVEATVSESSSSPMDRLQSLGTPLNWRSTRSVGEACLELELTMEKDQLEVISDEKPLLMKAPQFQPGDDYAVIATDGKLLFPVGASIDTGVVAINWLPPEESLSDQKTPATRSLGRTLQLYVFKLLKWPTGTLGLHSARFVHTDKLASDAASVDDRVVKVSDGEVRYRHVKNEQFNTGERVALFVHGFNSDSFWMASKISQLFEKNSIKYDHVLTFDYESLATSVRDNGKSLAAALKRAGFSKDDGRHLDVIAHSMGCVVSRSMIELEGGSDYVDRCVMAGPPNMGTPLADTGKLMAGFAVTLLNFASNSTIADLAGKSLKKFSGDAVGPFDLKPSSKLYEDLAKTEPAGTVPYFVLAGSSQLNTDAKGMLAGLWNGFNKGGNVALSVMFDGQHDLVIGVGSMIGVQNGKYPASLLKTQVVDSDHFQYFDNPDSQQQVVTWLAVE